MSEPMRFSLKHHGQLSCVEHCPEGEYVLHSDYAKLKAEVERLEAFTTRTIIPNEELQAENTRLKEQVRYFSIEAKDFESKWLMVLEDNARIKDDYNRLLIHCEALERDIEEGKKS